MKPKKTLTILASALLLLSSCQNEIQEKIEYTPIKGYNGKVRKITEYEYESEMDRHEHFAIWGINIPKNISEYNEYGRETRSIDIDIPDDVGEDFEITIDSSFYDKRQNLIRNIRYEFNVCNDDIATLISDWNIQKFKPEYTETLYAYKYKDDQIVERTIIWRRVESEHENCDTVKHSYTYIDGKLIEEQYNHSYRNEPRKDITKYTYDQDLLIAKESIDSEGKSTISTYTYKDGKLVEEKKGDLIIKYDAQERCISRLSKTLKEITLYSEEDSTYLYTSENEHMASVIFEYPYQKENNFSVSVWLDEGARHKNKFANLILKYGKNEEKRYLLISEIKNLFDDIYEENQCWVDDKKVEKVDEYENAIVINRNRTTLRKINLFYSGKVYQYDYHYQNY